MDYWLHIIILVCIYGCLAMSLDLLAGHTGLLSMAHSAFFGTGAYVAAGLSTWHNCSFAMSSCAAIGSAGILSLLLAVPLLHFRSNLFVIVSYAFQLVMMDIFRNVTAITNGSIGISNIPSVEAFGVTFNTPARFLTMLVVPLTILVCVMRAIVGSPFGRVLHIIREDEVYAASLGKNVASTKIKVFTVSAMIAGACGSLFAHYMSYIDPSSFSVSESMLLFSIVVVGGPASRGGVILGALILVGLPEILRFVGVSGSASAHIRQILFGGFLTILMLYRPNGLIGRYSFGNRTRANEND